MFKKKEKTEKEPREKKMRTMKVGTHKKSVLLLWAVLLASTSFGVYKNFTSAVYLYRLCGSCWLYFTGQNRRIFQ